MGPLPGSDNYVESSRTEDMKLGKEFRIGFFVTVILAVSFALINFLRGKDIFNREMTVISHYDDVAGLVPSAPLAGCSFLGKRLPAGDLFLFGVNRARLCAFLYWPLCAA